MTRTSARVLRLACAASLDRNAAAGRMRGAPRGGLPRRLSAATAPPLVAPMSRAAARDFCGVRRARGGAGVSAPALSPLAFCVFVARSFARAEERAPPVARVAPLPPARFALALAGSCKGLRRLWAACPPAAASLRFALALALVRGWALRAARVPPCGAKRPRFLRAAGALRGFAALFSPPPPPRFFPRLAAGCVSTGDGRPLLRAGRVRSTKGGK